MTLWYNKKEGILKRNRTNRRKAGHLRRKFEILNNALFLESPNL
jgi:hypothetical protein